MTTPHSTSDPYTRTPTQVVPKWFPKWFPNRVQGPQRAKWFPVPPHVVEGTTRRALRKWFPGTTRTPGTTPRPKPSLLMDRPAR